MYKNIVYIVNNFALEVHKHKM